MSSKALRWILPLLLLIGGSLFGGSGICFAQATNSGDVRGVVTDSSGAVIPGVTITAKNMDKDVTTVFKTNAAGLYDTGPIVPNHYMFTFTRDGFKAYVRGPVTIDADIYTVNVQLAVGATTQQVIVTTELPLLSTESGALEGSLESQAMQDLPMNATGTADWENFIVLLPGAAGTPENSEGSANPQQAAAINGNMPFSSTLSDGASTTLPQSQNSDMLIFETTSEVKISNSAFSAQYGVGNIIYNQITKGGTDHFHGAAYLYDQNALLDAASYGFGAKNSVPAIHYNNFGFAVGGPVKPLKKIFFYFDYDKVIAHSASHGFVTVPDSNMLAGDFSGRDSAGNPFPTIYDPTTQVFNAVGGCTYADGSPAAVSPCVQRTSFAAEYGQGNKIPVGMLNPAAKAINAFYPTPNNVAASSASGAGYQINNYAYREPSNDPTTRYFGRLDWTPTQNNRLTTTESEGDSPQQSLGEGFCPIDCEHVDISDYNNAQISDVWTISSSLINEARIGFADELDFYVPYGANGEGSTGGWASQLNMPMLNPTADYIPAFHMNHSSVYGIESNSSGNSVYKEMNFDPSDTVTLIKGRHVLHFGGEFLINRADSTNWGNINSASLNFNGLYTSEGANNTSGRDGFDYADFLLGQVNSWSAGVSPEYSGRWKSPQLFVQEDWKARPNLTLNLGLRWEGETGWRDNKNNATTWDPSVVSMDVIDAPAPCTTATCYGQVAQGGMWYEAAGQNNRTSLQAPKYDIILPRVGFSWQMRNNTVVKGGIGMFAATWSEDTYGGGLGSAFAINGNVGDSSNGRCSVVQLNDAGTSPDTTDTGCGISNATNGTPIRQQLFNSPTTPWAYEGTGSNVNYNKYHASVPTNYQWNLGVQRQFAKDYAAEIDYVGNHGMNLGYNVDIDQVPQSQLAAVDQQFKPYPLYGSINGSTDNGKSNYNALQAILTKRMSYGLSFTVNYTWSHFLADMDSSNQGGKEGNQEYQNAYSPSSNYTRSNYDIRQAFKGSAVYKLPFGKGGMFLNSNALADEVVGGWQISATFVAQTGNPFEMQTYANTTNAGGGSQFPNLIGNYKTGGAYPYHSLQEWYNSGPSAFQIPANYTFGTFRTNQLSGPDLTDINFSLGKSFDLWSERGVKFQIRGDVTNLLNHPSFGLPNSNAVGSTFSSLPSISSTTVGGRAVQFYGRLSF